MKKQYQVIHIDTNDVAMCEKITIDGKDYYVNNDEIPYGEYYISLEDNYATEPKTRYVIYNRGVGLNGSNPKLTIATTNTLLQCPQVVNYVEELANNSNGYNVYAKEIKDPVFNEGFITGFNQHSETHSLSDEEVKLYTTWLLKLSKNTYIVKHIDFDGSDSYIADEVLKVFKQTLPTKVYYR